MSSETPRALLWRSLLRHLTRHPWQLALAVLGVTLGVAVVLAVDLANVSAQRSFELSRQQFTGTASHQITAAAGVPQDLYRTLRVAHGLRALAPLVSATVALADNPERRLRLLGIDPLAVAAYRNPALTPTADNRNTATVLTQLLREPGAALVAADLDPGQELRLLVDGRVLPLRVAGRLHGPRQQGLVVVDIAVAQTALGLGDRLSAIVVDLDSAPDPGTQQRRLTALLPAGTELQRNDARTAALAELSASFRLNLTAMSLLALLVGMFLIYNSMTFTVVQRRRLFGLLRALGVGRGQLLTVILGEALLLGSIGTLLGCLLGWWLGSGLVGLVTRTMGDLYYTMTVTTFSAAPLSVLKAATLGLIATLTAAWLPAMAAAGAPPGAALSRADLETRWRHRLPWLAGSGVLLLAGGAALLAASSGLSAGFAGLFVIVLGCALLTPAAVYLASLMALRLASGPLIALGLRGVSRQLSRTGVAVAALTVAFAATVGVGVMVDSFRSGVVGWLEQLLSADVYLSAAGPGADLDPAVATRLVEVEGVSALSLYRWRELSIAGRPVALGALSATATTRAGYRLLDGAGGGNAENVWQTLQQRDAVLVSEPLAYRLGLRAGDVISLPTPDGPAALSVAGVFYDYSSEHGRVLIDLDHYRRRWRDPALTSLAVFIDPGATPEAVIDRLRQAAGQPLNARSNRAIFDLSLALFDRTFTITEVLRLLAVLVAVLGMLGALLALALERAREFAVLRALGMTGVEVGLLGWLQAGVLGLLAGMLALPVGLLLAKLLLAVINRRAFGWSLPFEVDPWLLAQSVALAVLSALAAGAYPFWRQWRAAAPVGAARAGTGLASELRTE